jgi:hypothetical protein
VSRQDNAKPGSALRPGFGRDGARHALDDVVADRQAEAGALAGRLGGEEVETSSGSFVAGARVIRSWHRAGDPDSTPDLL